MDRLFNSPPTKLTANLYNVVSREFARGFAGEAQTFFYDIFDYLNEATESYTGLSNCGHRLISIYANKMKWGKADTLLEAINPMYSAIFAVLEGFVVLTVDTQAEGYPTTICTRNKAIIKQLHYAGMLEADLESLLEALEGSKTERSVWNANFVAVRLDLIRFMDNKPIFRAVVPRSNYEFGWGRRHIAIPVPFMYMFEDSLKSHTIGRAFELYESHTHGIETKRATTDPRVVKKVYEKYESNVVNAKIRWIRCGYDVTKMRFFAYDLESSVYSVGLVSFRPEMIDSIRHVEVSDINDAVHGVNFSHLRGIFRTRVTQAKNDQLDSLNLGTHTGFANMSDKVEYILEKGKAMSDLELYWFMRNNPDVFDKIDSSLETRNRLTPKFLKRYKEVKLPENTYKAVEMLQEMLANGVVRFTAYTKNNSVYKRVASNNPKVLARVLGKDYVKKYESIRNRLYYVQQLLDTGKVNTMRHLEKVGVEYNILDHVDKDLYFSDAIHDGDCSDALLAVKMAIDHLRNSQKGRNIIAGQVTYRDIDLSDRFYGNVNVNNIISLEYSPYE